MCEVGSKVITGSYERAVERTGERTGEAKQLRLACVMFKEPLFIQCAIVLKSDMLSTEYSKYVPCRCVLDWASKEGYFLIGHETKYVIGVFARMVS